MFRESGSNDDLCLSAMNPAVENSLSHGTVVDGTAKYFFAIVANRG